MWKKVLCLFVLLLAGGCGEEQSLEPDELILAFIGAYEAQDAKLLVSYLSSGEVESLQPMVEEIRNHNDPNGILDIAGIELSDSEIRRLDAETFYILSFEAQWESFRRMNLEVGGFDYVTAEPSIAGDTATVDVTRSGYSGEETNTWIVVRDDGLWKIDNYHL